MDATTKIISFVLEEESCFRAVTEPGDLEAGLQASELGKIWQSDYVFSMREETSAGL